MDGTYRAAGNLPQQQTDTADTRTERGGTARGPRQASAGPGGRRDSRRPGGRGPGRAPTAGRTAGSGTAGGTPGRTARGTQAAAPAPPVLDARRREQPPYWFAERLLAVLTGRRPVHWMLGHTLGDAYDHLVRIADGTPLLPANRAMPTVWKWGEFHPRPGVIEAFALITGGGRLRAMAFRLEQGPEDRRWRCAAVDLDNRDTSGPEH
ncbi:Rv3235 family protein [Streptomyces tsukubensis]|uniref:Rv3235 family protein n=1 Tax=Streptomyces tsukubensis TaxID=83656 RepID=UPI00344D07DA